MSTVSNATETAKAGVLDEHDLTTAKEELCKKIETFITTFKYESTIFQKKWVK